MAKSQQIVTFLDIFYFDYTIDMESNCEAYFTYLCNLTQIKDNEILKLDRAYIYEASHDLW
jgi:hypothetical protein